MHLSLPNIVRRKMYIALAWIRFERCCMEKMHAPHCGAVGSAIAEREVT